MAESTDDKIERHAKAMEKTAEDLEAQLEKDGFPNYPAKPSDRDFRKGYATASRDNARALRE